MDFEFSEHQKEIKDQARGFVEENIANVAGQFDREEKIPKDLLIKMANNNYLGTILPEVYGGLGWNMLSFGILNEEIGKGCSSVRSLLTVHGMCSYAIMRWGTDQQKESWLPRLSQGEVIGAFALSEAAIGSDAKAIKTEAIKKNDCYILNGEKKWITFGQIADLFLVIAQTEGKPIACLVERNQAGIQTEPMTGLLGTRGSMLAKVILKECKVPPSNIIGGPGFGFSAVALSALDIGRFSVATGSVGIAQACIDSCHDYATKRTAFGEAIGNKQLIRKMLADMDTNTRAARLLCYSAADLADKNDTRSSMEIMRAKYYSGKTANDVARDAVQIHGGNGCSQDYRVERLYRDAKIMEIIEGTNEMIQLVLGKPYVN